jgi:hypothetical protein
MSEQYEDPEDPDMPCDRLYDDDMYFSSNADLTDEMTDLEKADKISRLSIAEASVWDLLQELDKRFNHYVFHGKRILDAEKGGADRDTSRVQIPRTDNRLIMKGDIHVLTGLSKDLDHRLTGFLEMGYPDLHVGFSEDDDSNMGYEDVDIWGDDDDDD